MDTNVRVRLTIELDPEVPIPLVQVALDNTGPEGDTVVVIATNWQGDERGAAAVAGFLRGAADAIDGELVRNGHHPSGASVPGPSRPRFNPRPAGMMSPTHDGRGPG